MELKGISSLADKGVNGQLGPGKWLLFNGQTTFRVWFIIDLLSLTIDYLSLPTCHMVCWGLGGHVPSSIFTEKSSLEDMASSQDNPMANGNGRTMALNNILHPGKDNLAFASDNNKQLARTESALSQEGFNPNLDHNDHDLFVQMDELEDHAWIERSR